MNREESIDTIDLIASDDPDMLLIASISALIKSLRLSAQEHLRQSEGAKSRAETSQIHGDNEAFRYWMNVHLEEYGNYKNIVEMLQQFNVIDKECESYAEPQNVEI